MELALRSIDEALRFWYGMGWKGMECLVLVMFECINWEYLTHSIAYGGYGIISYMEFYLLFLSTFALLVCRCEYEYEYVYTLMLILILILMTI